IMRLSHLRVKLSTPIRNVRDGAGVVGAQPLTSSNDQPLLDPQLPGRPNTMGSSTRTSKLGTWGARRFAKCPAMVSSSQCMAMSPETKRKPVIVAAAATTASNGPCSSTKLSCIRTSQCWRAKSNRRAPMLLLPVAV
ncbi:hypothetical protein TcG_11338, partial [Trypanosoma cruzi]